MRKRSCARRPRTPSVGSPNASGHSIVTGSAGGPTPRGPRPRCPRDGTACERSGLPGDGRSARLGAVDLSGAAVRFPGLRRQQDGRTVVFADAPGGSQVPDAVVEAMADYLRRSNANAHGSFATSQETDDLIAEAHGAAADLLNADDDEVVFGPNATTLLFSISRSIARSLEPGDE